MNQAEPARCTMAPTSPFKILALCVSVVSAFNHPTRHGRAGNINQPRDDVHEVATRFATTRLGAEPRASDAVESREVPVRTRVASVDGVESRELLARTVESLFADGDDGCPWTAAQSCADFIGFARSELDEVGLASPLPSPRAVVARRAHAVSTDGVASVGVVIVGSVTRVVVCL